MFICAHLWLFSSPAQADWQVSLVSSLQKLTAVSPGALEPFKSEAVDLRTVRGEWENFQIVIQAGDEALKDVEPLLSDLTSNTSRLVSENIYLFWEHYVYVPQPSGNKRLDRLWWPDALIPAELQSNTSIEPHRARVLWVNVRVPQNTAPGTYRGQIQIRASNETKSLPVQLKIENSTLPAPTMRANVAVYYDVLRDWYAKNARALSNDEFTVLKKNYYDFLLDYRINAYDLPVDWKSDEAQKYLKDPRVLSVRTPPLDRADFNDAIAAFKKANALKKAYYYWIDEPAPEQYQAVKNATQKLRQLGIKHCVTAHPNQSLNGAVDIWCPNIGDFFGLKQVDYKMLEAQRKKGCETWLYTMAWPRYPYPTWLLDDEAKAIRSYSWGMRQHNITGFVYSMAHGWGPNPFQNLQSFGETNGDGTLLYPAILLDKGNLSPLPGIRLMLLRDMIEDYELKRPVLKPQFPARITDNSKKFSWPLQNTHSQPKIDGLLNDLSWNTKSQLFNGLERLPKETPPVTTKVWASHHRQNLLIAARCPLMPRSVHRRIKGEWFAVDLAPLKADVRWRFIVTPSGKGIVEKHTREGHFRIEGVKWKFAARAARDFYNIEMQIPLDEIGLENRFFFNARRRLHDTQLDIHYLLQAFPDAETITLMLPVTLE